MNKVFFISCWWAFCFIFYAYSISGGSLNEVKDAAILLCFIYGSAVPVVWLMRSSQTSNRKKTATEDQQ